MAPTDTVLDAPSAVGPAELAELIRREQSGEDINGLLLVPSTDGQTMELPAGTDLQRPVIVGDSIALIQPDGSIVVLLGAADQRFVLDADAVLIDGRALAEVATPETDWTDAASVAPHRHVESEIGYSGTSGEEIPVSVPDPLVGLAINPLLPPTFYLFPPRRDEEYAKGSGPGGIHIDPLDPEVGIGLTETDAPISFRISDYYSISASIYDEALDFATIDVSLSGLPIGTTVSAGTLTPAADGTLTLTFSGSYDDFRALTLTLPTDFSTDSRLDAVPGSMTGTIHLTTIMGDDVTTPITIRVEDEGDIRMDGSGVLDLAETDGPVDFRPADGLLPVATDRDGSETVEEVRLSLSGLPPGTLVSFDGGDTFSAQDGTLTFRGSLEAYQSILVRLPTDFSTANPLSTITGEVSATTNEGGSVSGSFDVNLAYELDVDLAAPALLKESEDSWGGDGSGVELALGIAVAATDADGSEDGTRVEIHYSGMPPGAYFLSGSYDQDTGIWRGTMDQANALVLRLPGDYSGAIDSVIRAISPEGVRTTAQRIEIAPTGDIDFDITELDVRETDARVTVAPSSAWKVSISDDDGGTPAEELNSIRLTLTGLPPGVLVSGVPSSTISYDPAAGGSFTFNGTGLQYQLLRLSFPKDYSTENPLHGPTGAIVGTLRATSSEDPAGDVAPVSLRIRPEGDVVIDDTLPDTVADETDDPTVIIPWDLLRPAATDADGSESVTGLALFISGLPNGSTLASLGITLPPEVGYLLRTTANGDVTLRLSIPSGSVADALAMYSRFSFELPADFSTANRNDLVSGTSMPLTLRLFAVTDEDVNVGIDLPNDGQAIATRVVDIGFEADLTLSAPDRLGVEDSIGGDGSGVMVDLGLVIDPVDIDGSEDVINVTISYANLPTGTVFMSGGVDLTANYDPATRTWTGSEAEAEALSLVLPGDFSGTITSQVTATSPEGSVTQTQQIVISPTGDIDFDVTDVTKAETDLPIRLIPSDHWTADVSDFDMNLPRERLVSVTLNLDGLPPGMVFNGVPSATYSYVAAGSGYSFTFTGTEAQYNALALVFPKDFSTESPPSSITGTISATSTEDATGATSPPFSVTITAEGDVTIDGSLPDMVPDESDAPTPVIPSGLLMPAATDADGSETIETLKLVIKGLPAGSTAASLGLFVPTDAVVAFTNDTDGSSILTIDMNAADVGDVVAAYSAIALSLPTDFSTANRNDITGATQRPLTLTLTVATDEDADLANDTLTDGQRTLSRQVDVGYELDVTLSAGPVTGVEDGDGGTVGGVTVDLDITVAATDADGSEDSTVVEIEFAGLPPDTGFNGGTFDADSGIWTGSMAEANALTMHLPPDYSGTITSTISAISPEGTTSTTQVVTITPTGDIDFTVPDIVVAETDATVSIRPFDSWKIDITDSDPGLPREVLGKVTLTLTGLPAGLTFAPTGNTTFTGGTLTFTGSYAAYQALQLHFPADYSTTSPLHDGDGYIKGTLRATSSEDAGGESTQVRLRITEEGDVEIDASKPDTIPDETDAATLVTPYDLLEALPTDADGSENLDGLVLTVTGLPAGSTAASLALTGIPASYATFTTAGDGSTTMTITLDSSVGNIATVYSGITFTLPPDFSTANRSDLQAGLTTLPLGFSLSATTDEGGTATASRSVDINYQDDITLTAPATLMEPEDGGPDSRTGTTVDLQIAISIDDSDLSEDPRSTDPGQAGVFGTTVRIAFVGLPSGGSVSTGTLGPGGIWTGTVAQANDLHLILPPDYNGTINSVIRVTTPEGSRTASQTITIEPTSDTIVDGQIEIEETDAAVTVLVSDYVSVLDPSGTETLDSVSISIPNMPPGMVSNAGSLDEDPAKPGTYIFTYEWSSTDVGAVLPADLTLTFPKDFSTENPNEPIVADVHIVSSDGPSDATVNIIVHDEGDVVIDGTAGATLTETDAVLDLRPAAYRTPIATDADASESVTRVTVSFNALPAGTQVSTDGGATFTAATATLDFDGSLEEFGNLVIRLPADYSTANPPASLYAIISAVTDEGGTTSSRLDVTIAAEEDLVVAGTGAISIGENDAPGDTDEDSTSQAPLRFSPISAWSGSARPSAGPDGDDDGSERTTTAITISGLPAGSFYSLNGGTTLVAVPPSGTLTLSGLSETSYQNLIVQLPNDFSTTTDITGRVTFTTDEGGSAVRDFTVTVTPEADVRISAEDITEVEDYVAQPPVGAGQTIPLNLDYDITDTDGSETLSGISVTFSGLPTNGPTLLSDGSGVISLTGPSETVTLTVAQYRALAITSLPDHFSGVIGVTVAVQTNEGGATTRTFDVNITPVAEPTISLSVDTTPPEVSDGAGGNFVVKEDFSFTLQIDADTPDKDGSEALTQIVIRNVPAGWLPDGAVSADHFTGTDAGRIASATMSGTTLTLTLSPGTTSFEAGVIMTPLANDDRDVATIVGRDMVATVTSQDTAAGLPTSTVTATDSVDVDVDAVADPITIDTGDDLAVSENISGQTVVPLGLSGIALTDTDGSEVFQSLEFNVRIDTASTDFDISRDLSASYTNPSVADYLDLTLVPISETEATVTIRPAAGVSSSQFAEALENLNIVFPQHFSGITTLDGTMTWAEANLSGVETDPTDNTRTETFTVVRTVLPVAESALTASVFVLTADEVADTSLTRIDASAKDGSVAGSDILTLLESTADGSSTAGQVNLFVGLEGSTPDTDGSEDLGAIVIHNVPADWLRSYVDASGTIAMGAFFNLTGTGPLGLSETDKIANATYDATTGEVRIAFNPGVTSFAGALNLQPTLYEDYDVDRENSDPFTAAGDFFGADLKIELVTQDTNTATTDDQSADTIFDVDVDPVNNFAVIVDPTGGNEQVIDDAGGVGTFTITPTLEDADGSETITAVVLRNVPVGLTIWVTDVNNPAGPKVPALITEIGPQYIVWSLESNSSNGVVQWQDFEIRGIPTHFAGNAVGSIDVVTTEADGGGTRVTHSDVPIYIEPVVDGGDPSETFATDEDTAVRITLDGNLIDNPTNSSLSPEGIAGDMVILNIATDGFGRTPRFFFGNPATGGVELLPVGGALVVTETERADLWLLPGQDSNETITFDVEVTYYETIDPSKTKVETGTITADVRGIADTPVIEVQDPAPSGPGNTPVPEANVDADYKVDPSYAYGDLYGYAGYENTPFFLTSKLSAQALELGYDEVSDAARFDAATPFEGTMTEIQDLGGNFDGSETLYYIITGVDPNVTLIGGFPLDDSGESYAVPVENLDSLQIISGGVDQVTYYRMQFHAIVIEDDQDLGTLPGPTVLDNIAYINTLPGGYATSEDFVVVVLPGVDDNDLPCGDDQKLPLPTLTLVGSGEEDNAIAFQIKLAPNAFYDSMDDLVHLPNGVLGDFTLAIDLPPGATLTSDPAGAVYVDPTTGRYVVDLGKLGVDPSDPTMTGGSIIFTPPAHQSSPDNPFPTDETLGPDDPYDGLDQLNYYMKLVNVNCGITQSATPSFDIYIDPVPDGPDIVFGGADSFDEDTPYALGLSVAGIDGGERLTGNVTLTFTGGGTNGVTLFDAAGNPIAPTSAGTYSVAPEDLAGLTVLPTEHFGGGTFTVTVTATTEDVDGTTKSNSESRTIDVIAVADTPSIEVDDSAIDPDTGLPYLDRSGPVPVLTIVEDIPFETLSAVIPMTPDQDGSEVLSVVVTIPAGLKISGPTTGGFIDNGDGTYTISQTAFPYVTLELDPEHARTPDAINTTIPTEFNVDIRVQTLEISNSDTAEFSGSVIIRVRPDADIPTLSASISPATGVEDDAATYALSLSATTPDPHEDMRFEITLPNDSDGAPLGRILLDGVEVPAVDGVVTIDGIGAGQVFAPSGTVTFVPAQDFGGDVSLSVVAVSIDADLDSGFVDEQASPAAVIDLTITPAPDLDLSVDTPVVTLTETDAPLLYAPAGGFTIDVTDVDGSEAVDSVTYTLTGVPDGTSWTSGGASGTASGGTLTFTGSLAQFTALQISFPTDFATNGTSVTGSIDVTTNEGGNESGSFTIDIDGELDLTVTNTTPIALAQTGTDMVVDFGILATVTDTQDAPSETLESVVIDFDAPLPTGTTASSGTFNGAMTQLTFTRGSTDPASFAAMVAALAITLPATAAAAIEGSITVTTNHGTGDALDFEVTLNTAPTPGPAANFDSHSPVFTIPVADLLTGATDAEGDGMTVTDLSTDDPDVSATIVGSNVVITAPDGYVGTPTLSFDITDDGTPPARSSSTASLDIDSLQMDATGAGPDGTQRMSDVTGAIGGTDIARGTEGADAVILDATTPYDNIEGFSMLGGDDVVDLTGATRGFIVDGGAGADRITGGSFADQLTGGAGDDIFVMTNLSTADVITDYDSPSGTGDHDQFDLTALVSLGGSDVIGDFVTYDSASGDLAVEGTTIASVGIAGGGFSDQVEVIFETASGAATAVI